MMCEKITADKRKDGSIVLTVPDEESIDLESAFSDGATCCRSVSENPIFDEESRDMALQAAECLERLETIFGQTTGKEPPEKTALRVVE